MRHDLVIRGGELADGHGSEFAMVGNEGVVGISAFTSVEAQSTDAAVDALPGQEEGDVAAGVRLADADVSRVGKQVEVAFPGGKDAIAPIPAISTGSISMDWALGVGGLRFAASLWGNRCYRGRSQDSVTASSLTIKSRIFAG